MTSEKSKIATELGTAPAEEFSRRDFLGQAAAVAATASGVALLAGGARLAWPNVDPSQPSTRSLGTPADFKMGTLTWLREDELFVARSAAGFAAFSSRCTHLGCTVRRTAEGFQCPCHGAQYDLQGRPIAGPARDPLLWFEVRVEADGHLWVDRQRRIPAGTYSAAGAGNQEVDR